ncbi:ribonuclease H-like domain-containing protein [Tanacetum coccineum]
MQKVVLKQQFKAFTISSSEGLEKGYDRFQQLLSQLEAHGAKVSTKDANHKFLRSLPPAWSNLAMTMRTKPDVDTLSIDDLYNNLRVFEQELTSTTKSSASRSKCCFCFTQEQMIAIQMKKFYKRLEGESGRMMETNLLAIDKRALNVSNVTTLKVEPICETHAKTPRQPMKNQGTPEVKGKNWNEMMERELGEENGKRGWSYETRVFNTGNGVAKLVWDNANRVNRANHFVPRLVQLNAVRIITQEHGRTVGIFDSWMLRGNMTGNRSPDDFEGIAKGDLSYLWRVKIIRSDNGTEFKNRDMLEFCGNKGIKQEYNNSGTPQQNRVAERINRTLIKANQTTPRRCQVTSEVTNSVGTLQTPNANISEEEDEAEVLIVMPTTLKHTEQKLDQGCLLLIQRQRSFWQSFKTLKHKRRQLILLAFQKILLKL